MADFPPHPRTVITGAGSGLGKAIALNLAQRGARILCTDIVLDRAEQTAEEVRAAGGEAVAMVCNVAEKVEIQALYDEAVQQWGGTDILVNNAGVAAAGKVGEVSLEDWDWLMEINLWGVIYGCHIFLPLMRTQGSGYILNVASSAGILAAPKMAPYNVAKAGVVSLSETLYGELSGKGVKVSVLCPTFFQSDLHQNIRSNDPRLIGLTQKLVTKAHWTSGQIANVALKGLKNGDLYIIPQLDGKVMWGLKRMAGQRFHTLLGALNNSGLLDRLAKRRRA